MGDAAGEPADGLHLLRLTQLILVLPQRDGHLVERLGHDARFGGTLDGQATGPVTAGQVVRRVGEIAQRSRQPAAEHQHAGDGDAERRDADPDQRVVNLVERAFGRRPVLQQHESRVSGAERVDPADIGGAAETVQRRRVGRGGA